MTEAVEVIIDVCLNSNIAKQIFILDFFKIFESETGSYV
jgi:hypothetical protein